MKNQHAMQVGQDAEVIPTGNLHRRQHEMWQNYDRSSWTQAEASDSHMLQKLCRACSAEWNLQWRGLLLTSSRRWQDAMRAHRSVLSRACLTTMVSSAWSRITETAAMVGPHSSMNIWRSTRCRLPAPAATPYLCGSAYPSHCTVIQDML